MDALPVSPSPDLTHPYGDASYILGLLTRMIVSVRLKRNGGVLMWPWDLKLQLNRIERKLDLLTAKENAMTAKLDQVVQDVQDESTVEDSLISLTTAIKAQLDAALANTSISPADQAKIDAIFTGLEANKAKLAAAITANTPVAPAA